MRFFYRLCLLVIGFSLSPNVFSESNKTEGQYKFVLPSDLIGDESVSYRDSWKKLTGFEGSGLHWNSFIRIFVSNNAAKQVYSNNFAQYLLWYEAYDEDEDEAEDPSYKMYPVGSIIVKENYIKKNDKPGDPLALSIMVKRAPGFDKDFGDWEYLQVDPTGNVLMRGNSKSEIIKTSCQSCHSNVPEKDFVFSSFLSRPVLSVNR
ncbi:cytochrome P460 family protein [bacterium]|nr:cytochrome P460 family protein [bacterium]